MSESATPGVPHGVMFHHFHGPAHPAGQGSIDALALSRLLDHIGPDRVLTPAKWLTRLDRGTLAPGDVCLTFDDGLLSQYEIALPVLNALGLKAFWFVYSSVFEGVLGLFEIHRVFRTRCFASIDAFYEAFFATVARAERIDAATAVRPEWAAEMRGAWPFYTDADIRYRLVRDRVLGEAAFTRVMNAMMREKGVRAADLAGGLWMTANHLRMLTDNGHHVGLHSYSHPTRLATLPPGAQYAEYARNFMHLSRVCGVPPRAAAHPVNSYTQTTLGILSALGIGCAFRSTMVPVAPGLPLNGSPLELAREDHTNLLRSIAALQ